MLSASLVTAAWGRIAATHDLIAVASSVAIGVARRGGPPIRAGSRAERSRNRDPSGRPHTHPPRIRWGQCGDGG